jgi:hypothetical protein
MIHCQNCGQINNYGSNFCRFCGSQIVMSQSQRQDSSPYEYKAPRPYVWKTDEFQLPPNNSAKKTGQINQVQPLTNFSAPSQPQSVPLPPPLPNAAYRQPNVYYGYRCPRCGTQNAPYLTKKISSAGWIVFAILLVAFFPLFWIGFLIKEDVKVCSVCNIRVG